MSNGLDRTIPFSVLRRIPVSPAFPAQKRAAIDGLLYTSVARTYVQTRMRFWLEDGISGNASTDLPVMGIYERTINQPGTRAILESYQAGANGSALDSDERQRAPRRRARGNGDGVSSAVGTPRPRAPCAHAPF